MLEVSINMDIPTLIKFEKQISKLYEDGLIRGPVHLRDGNEKQLVDIFKSINPEDYVFSTWANHLHALLKGIPAKNVKDRILESQSMAMNFPEYRFFTSAIVGGIPSIAIGTAISIKRNRDQNRVWCFLGDMAFRSGIAHESIMYAISNSLPITFVIEDNEKSVDTPTQNAWGIVDILEIFEFYYSLILKYQSTCGIMYYKYKLSYPHSGTGTFVEF
jgi:pyruvate dehydrogenase E1 component alpha subunit